MSKHLSTFLIPSEVVENILMNAGLSDVYAFAQTCRAYRSLVHDTGDQNPMWRELYLGLPLDDPRQCLDSSYRKPTPRDAKETIIWKKRVDAFIRASALARKPERSLDLQTAEMIIVLSFLINLALWLPPSEEGQSQNVLWLREHLSDGNLFASCSLRDHDATEQVLLAQLHTLVGFVDTDGDKMVRVRSRAMTYDVYHYREATSWGPFIDAPGLYTEWKVLQAIHHVIVMHVKESDDLDKELPPSCFTMQGPQYPISSVHGDWIGISDLWNGKSHCL